MSESTRNYSYYVEKKTLEEQNRPERFLQAFAAILEHSNYALALDAYSQLSAKCGRCASNCQLYQATQDTEHIPCHRSEYLLRVYRRYFTPGGLFKAKIFNGFELTDEYLDRMGEVYYQCTACRRCKFTCPMGLDHGLITHLARWILSEISVVPKALTAAVREQLEGSGNTSAIPVPALMDTLEFLEDEFKDVYNVEIKFPVDVEGAEHVFFPAVSDYLLEPDTLMGQAAVMALSGGSWTIGTGNYDGINYGLFYNDRYLEQISKNEVAEVKRLNGDKLLIGECGHATRSAWLARSFNGPSTPAVLNFLQYTYKAMVEGKLPLREKFIEGRVTYHDPCNIARAGKITEEPREILKVICKDFVEMTPNRTQNYCCGGGGGSVSVDEMRDFRTKTMGKAKADQIRATGANFLVAPCANCKKQLKEVIEDNGLDGVEVIGLHDLVLKALDFSKLQKEQGRLEEEMAANK